MLPGYHLLFREHARRTIHKAPQQPEVALGIFPAENLKPQKQEVFFGTAPRDPKIKPLYTVERNYWTGEGKLVTPDDFSKEGYYGMPTYSF